MTTIEHLRAARALIEKGWCQDDYAKDRFGNPRDVNSPFAEEFCAVGACIRAIGCDHLNDDYCALLRNAGGIDCITLWNDTPGRTQSDVLALFDKAIALEESKGGQNE